MRHPILLLVLIPALLSTGCGNDVFEGLTALPSGLGVEELYTGSDPYPQPGQLVTLSYTATLADGTKVDSTTDRGQDFTFRLGSGSVIPGLEAAVSRLRVGSHARVTIPPDQAYGEAGAPPDIPPDATLIYDLWVSSAQ